MSEDDDEAVSRLVVVGAPGDGGAIFTFLPLCFGETGGVAGPDKGGVGVAITVVEEPKDTGLSVIPSLTIGRTDESEPGGDRFFLGTSVNISSPSVSDAVFDGGPGPDRPLRVGVSDDCLFLSRRPVTVAPEAGGDMGGA